MRQFLTVLICDWWAFAFLILVEVQTDNSVKSTPDRQFISFLFCLKGQHQGIHTIVFSARKILWPFQTSFCEPRFFTVTLQSIDLFNHHLCKTVKCLILSTWTICIKVLLIVSHS